MKMNRLTKSAIALMAMGASVLSHVAPIAAHTYQAGTYTATAEGFHGPVEVTVTVGEDGKVSVSSKNTETQEIGAVAIDKIVEKYNTDQDAVIETIAGATYSSDAFKKALDQALAQAAGEEATEEESEATSDEAAKHEFKAGTYTGKGQGMGGDIVVEVTVTDDKIETITIKEDDETSGLAEQVFEKIPQMVIDNQSLNIDVLSGATVSSVGTKMAIEDALKQAGADIDALKKAPVKDYKEDGEYQYDVVVAGAGLAGLTSAIKAAESGAKVALIEKTGVIGGTSIFASGNILGASEEKYVEPMFKEWNKRSASQEANPVNQELLRHLVEKSPEVMKFMFDNGVEFKEEVDEERGFQTFRAKPNEKSKENAEHIKIPSKEANTKGGAHWIEELTEAAKKAGVEFYLNTPATELIKEDGAITGVVSDTEKYGKKIFHAKAVVLATGDYARNEELTNELAPQAAGEYTATAIGNTGDGLKMILDAGGVLTKYQESMSGAFNANPSDMPMIGDPTNGYPFEALLLNNDGKRVFKEDGGSHPQKFKFVDKERLNGAWCIMDSKAAANFVRLDEYVKRTADGDPVIKAYKADSIEQLAKDTGLDEATLKASVDRYNEMVKQGEDTDFEKDPKWLQSIDDGTYYAVYLYDGTRGNYGGVVTDQNAAVVDKDGNEIKGLYAPGIISSGEYFGDYYPGRQALGIASHMGYVAGEAAAEFAKK